MPSSSFPSPPAALVVTLTLAAAEGKTHPDGVRFPAGLVVGSERASVGHACASIPVSMRVLLWHGWLLDGTGSNVYAARVAEVLVSGGPDVVVLCQEPPAERHPGVVA